MSYNLILFNQFKSLIFDTEQTECGCFIHFDYECFVFSRKSMT